MAITYTCLGLSNPPGPGIVVTVGVNVGAQGQMVFEIPITKAECANLGQVDPMPFVRRIGRALLRGTAPAALIGVSEVE